MLEAFDPSVLKKPAESSEQRTCAQPDPAIAESLNILYQGIPVTRFICQADQDKENRLGQWLVFYFFMLLGDVSHSDILLIS